MIDGHGADKNFRLIQNLRAAHSGKESINYFDFELRTYCSGMKTSS
jgi:hypothetical protein